MDIMLAVLRISRSQQMALCQILTERLKDKTAGQTFVNVDTDPPTTITTAELYELLCDISELEIDTVVQGQQYPGMVTQIDEASRYVYVCLTEMTPRRHVKALVHSGTFASPQIPFRLEVGEEVLCEFNESEWHVKQRCLESSIR